MMEIDIECERERETISFLDIFINVKEYIAGMLSLFHAAKQGFELECCSSKGKQA